MKRDEAKQLADNGIEDLRRSLEAGHSEALERYLTVMSKFHSYSWNNCILIGVQMPEASHVAGFHRWLQLGRRVRKGEKGIGIMAPLARRKQAEATDSEADDKTMIFGFKVVHVFDISQTDGDDLPEFAGINGEPGEMLSRLESLIRTAGITLIDESLPLGVHGVSRQGEIVISSALDDAERFAVLVHEWAHERMHDTHRRKFTSKTVRETEAEAVSFVVCHALGLDCTTRSSDYIHLYRGTTETLAESLQLIKQTAAELIHSLGSNENEKASISLISLASR